MLWIPITVFAAFAQTVRNAAQRHLVTELGTLGATLVRFLYGLPFAVAWLAIVVAATGITIPTPPLAFFGWCVLGAVSQVAGTALLLQTMRARNFAVGVAYSKTEVVQVAILSVTMLGDPLSLRMAAAVAAGTVGVLLLAPADPQRPFRSLVEGFTSRAALLGLGCGAGLAMASVAYRGAALTLPTTSFLVAAATALVVAQTMQTVLLGGWLLARSPDVVLRTLAAWRVSLFAGFMGAAASAGWFTAFAIQPVTSVRTLGLIEMVFSYGVSRRFFREQITRRELAGMAMLALAVLTIATG